MSQNSAILDYLKRGGHLTGLDGLRLFGTMKLASRISEIKDETIGEPFAIKDRIIESTNGKHYKEYWIEHKIVVKQQSNGQAEFVMKGA